MNKILFITSNITHPWGGSEVLWSELALKCIEYGHNIGVCIHDWNPKPKHIQNLERSGATIFPNKTHQFSIKDRLLRKFLNYNPNKKYFDSLVEFKPNLVIISQGGNQDGEWWMHFCIDNRLPYMVIAQAAAEPFWPHPYHIQRLKEGYSKALKSFFVSKANAHLTQLQITHFLPNAKVISNPFNVPYNNNIKYPSPNGVFKLGNVARHEIQAKAHEVLFEVLSYDKWKNRSLKVSLYGSGVHTEALRDMISMFNLNNVELKGFESTTKIWEENHALVLPSRYEGLPLSLVEAMLCGRFGIVSDVSGNTEVLIDNENGFVAAAPKPKYLDEAMERAWIQRDSWEEIGMKAKSYIRNLVPEDPIEEIYKEIFKSRK